MSPIVYIIYIYIYISVISGKVVLLLDWDPSMPYSTVVVLLLICLLCLFIFDLWFIWSTTLSYYNVHLFNSSLHSNKYCLLIWFILLSFPSTCLIQLLEFISLYFFLIYSMCPYICSFLSLFVCLFNLVYWWWVSL